MVHTDDIAWAHSRFGWTDLLIGGVLEPLHQSEPVTYRPPAWDVHGRVGSIAVPHTAVLVIIEGVGASRPGLRDLVDATVYIRANRSDIERRNAARVRSGETTASGVRTCR